MNKTIRVEVVKSFRKRIQTRTLKIITTNLAYDNYIYEGQYRFSINQRSINLGIFLISNYHFHAYSSCRYASCYYYQCYILADCYHCSLMVIKDNLWFVIVAVTAIATTVLAIDSHTKELQSYSNFKNLLDNLMSLVVVAVVILVKVIEMDLLYLLVLCLSFDSIHSYCYYYSS